MHLDSRYSAGTEPNIHQSTYPRGPAIGQGPRHSFRVQLHFLQEFCSYQTSLVSLSCQDGFHRKYCRRKKQGQLEAELAERDNLLARLDVALPLNAVNAMLKSFLAAVEDRDEFGPSVPVGELQNKRLLSRGDSTKVELNAASSFFLDSFLRKILDNVLLFFSRLPNAKDWAPHIRVRDLLGLFAVRGEIGNFIKARFNTLVVSTTSNCDQENVRFRWKLQTEGHVWADSIDDARAFILEGGGESLCTVIGIGMLKKERDNADLAGEFMKHCPNIISLSIYEHGTSWLDIFGKQLEKLEVRTGVPLDFPGQTCR